MIRAFDYEYAYEHRPSMRMIDDTRPVRVTFSFYFNVCFSPFALLVYTRINLGQKNMLSVMYNGNLKGEKLQNIIEKAKKPKVKKKRDDVRNKHVCSHNNYTLIIFVFLSNINRSNENAKCIMPLLLLYN